MLLEGQSTSVSLDTCHSYPWTMTKNVDRIPVTTRQDQELTPQDSGEMAHPRPQSLLLTEHRALHAAKGNHQDK